MKNTENCKKVIATFLFKQEGRLNYKDDLIILREFRILDNGKTWFEYFSYNENQVLHDIEDTLLFSKLFSIDVNSLL